MAGSKYCSFNYQNIAHICCNKKKKNTKQNLTKTDMKWNITEHSIETNRTEEKKKKTLSLLLESI